MKTFSYFSNYCSLSLFLIMSVLHCSHTNVAMIVRGLPPEVSSRHVDTSIGESQHVVSLDDIRY